MIKALRGWLLVANGVWYDGAMRMPKEEPSASRVQAAHDAGLVVVSSLGVSVRLTDAGEALVRKAERRATHA